MDVYTPARTVDFTDTGLWRLIIYISQAGMSALLRHVEDASQPLVSLFSTSWDQDESLLLPKIESAVYDNPRLLEDYATEIIVETKQLTWIPTDIVEENEVEDVVFGTLFPTATDSPMTDTAGRMTALFSLTNGLQSFISRTLPGARVRSHLAVLVNHFGKLSGDNPHIFVDIRADEADMILFNRKSMLMAVTHQWHSVSDIGYRAAQLASAYGITPRDVTVTISGLHSVAEPLKEIMVKAGMHANDSDLPDPEQTGIPTAAVIAAG